MRITVFNRALTGRLLPISTAGLAATLALGACGSSGTTPGAASSSSSSSTSSASSHDMGAMPGSSSASPSVTRTPADGDHNDADVTFATGMTPHHAQAVQMAEMALKQGSDAQLKDLAAQIEAAQDPEIQQMTGWLKGWGAPVPDTSMGHDMSSMAGPMAGMMSDQEMADLAKARGTAFDQMWLQMMTKHHRGAVEMAKTELTSGNNGEAKRLAQSIIDSQTKEIGTMQQILSSIGS